MNLNAGQKRKTAVITGGAGGLGKAMAIMLAKAGFNIALVDLNPEQGQAAKEEVAKYGPCEFFPFNVTNYDEAPALYQKIYDHFGSIDALANNAGISPHRGTTETIRQSDWDKVISVNLKGPFFMAKAVAPFMEKSGGGSIINTASVRGYLATGDRTLYAITKWGMKAMTTELATDFWRFGIRVNSFSPGYVLTEMTKAHLDEPGWLDNQLNIFLIDKMLVPEDIAEVVTFLASDESIAINGLDIPCEGGTIICRGKPAESGL